MPSRVSVEETSQAIFHSVEDGTFPEDEQIISAELSSTALNSLSELLEQARADVKVGIQIDPTTYHNLSLSSKVSVSLVD